MTNLTRPEAAKYLCISPRTLDRLRLPRSYIGNKPIYRVDDLDAYVEKQMVVLPERLPYVGPARQRGPKMRLSRPSGKSADFIEELKAIMRTRNNKALDHTQVKRPKKVRAKGQTTPKEPKPPKGPQTSYVYGIAETGHGPIKIGVSTRPDVRLAKLQTSNSAKLHIFFTVATSKPYEVEKLVHSKLARWRLRGEWFRERATAAERLVREIADSVADVACSTEHMLDHAAQLDTIAI